MTWRAITVKVVLPAFVSAGVIASALWYMLWARPVALQHWEMMNYDMVKMMLKWYIADAAGEFPENIQSLQAKGYLSDLTDERWYHIPATGNPVVVRGTVVVTMSPMKVDRRYVEMVNFGVSLGSTYVEEGVLRSKETKKAVCLLQVETCGRIDQGQSMAASVELFRYAQRIKRGSNTSGIGATSMNL